MLSYASIGVLLLASCYGQPGTATPNVTPVHDTVKLKLASGQILANQEDGVIYARGIKYATAERFEKPVPAEPWSGIRDHTQPATICPQNPSRFDFLTGSLTANRTQSEDCLHVSVAAPANASNLPVMVFIHGGAYLSGGGDLDVYSPVPLAQRGAVVVTITHRLGLLGYLPIQDVAPANLGLFDQIEALRWVKKNGASFGGDPGSVTLFGQSAGGDSVFALLAADNSKDLFHRAILESAPLGRLNETTRDDMTAAMSEYASANISSSMSPPTLERLLALQTAVLVVARPIDPTILAYGPVFGEEPLPPLSDLSQTIDAAAERVPIFIGYNKDEGSAFATIDPSQTAEWYKTNVFENGSNQLAKNISDATGHMPPMYHFNWSPPDSPWGAAHTIELPFLLGGWDAWAGAPMLNGSGSRGVVENLGMEVKDLWIAFAKGEDLEGRFFVIDEGFEFAS